MWWSVGFALLFVVIGLLVWWLDPLLRRGRAFEAELTAREPMSQNEMVRRYFANDSIPADVPGEVRRIFARHMEYPAEKLLPDDDLAFFWAELDMIDLVKELESTFAITITDTDAERTPCTIRAVAMLVADKASSASSTSWRT